MGCMTERSERRPSICISPLHHKSHAALPWALERGVSYATLAKFSHVASQ